MKLDHIIAIIILVFVTTVTIWFALINSDQNKKDNCDDTKIIFVRETIQCPSDKPYVKIWVHDNRGYINCCEK